MFSNTEHHCGTLNTTQKQLGKEINNPFVWKLVNILMRQECIAVGCVPAARWPYAGVCFRGEGEGRGVVCSGGWCLLPGGLLQGGGGWSATGGWSAPRGWCLLPGGSALGGCLPQTCPPPCEQNNKQVQKYYLGHNFVAAGNNCGVLEFFVHWTIGRKRGVTALREVTTYQPLSAN